MYLDIKTTGSLRQQFTS